MPGDGHTRSAIIRLLLESGPITASRIGDGWVFRPPACGATSMR